MHILSYFILILTFFLTKENLTIKNVFLYHLSTSLVGNFTKQIYIIYPLSTPYKSYAICYKPIIYSLVYLLFTNFYQLEPRVYSYCKIKLENSTMGDCLWTIRSTNTWNNGLSQDTKQESLKAWQIFFNFCQLIKIKFFHKTNFDFITKLCKRKCFF